MGKGEKTERQAARCEGRVGGEYEEKESTRETDRLEMMSEKKEREKKWRVLEPNGMVRGRNVNWDFEGAGESR